jgi:glycosyltransferase involved in cell wall biosynthesis
VSLAETGFEVLGVDVTRPGSTPDRVLALNSFLRCQSNLRLAMGLPSRSRVDIRLVIAGAARPRVGLFRMFDLRDRMHFTRVSRRSHRAGLDDIVVLTDYVPEDDVAGRFEAAAGLVLPYRPTEQGAVASLADAFGVPVLASKVGGLAEQYASSPWLFSPRNPQELASVLARFVATPPWQRALPAGPRAAAEMETVLDATLSIYRVAVQPWSVTR